MRKKTFLKRTVFLLGDLFCMFGNLVSYCKGFAKNDTDLLNPKIFLPDTTFETHFPWDDVKPCFKNKLESNDFENHDNCPKCKLKSEKLIWINFSSPRWTWRESCGREGPLSICPKCNIQVEFIIECMN